MADQEFLAGLEAEVAHGGTAPRHRRLASALRAAVAPNALGSAEPARGFRQLALARAALRHADQLRAQGGRSNPAVLLYVAAARLMVDAEGLARGLSFEPDEPFSERWRRLCAHEPRGPLVPLSPGALERVIALLGPAGERELAEQSPARTAETSALLAQFTRVVGEQLGRQADRAERHVLLRRLRLGAFALSALLVVAYAAHLLAPENLARGAKVTVLHGLAEYEPAKLVDGDRSGIGFHTAAPPAEVTLELGAPRRIERAVVYNRDDCCRDRAVPLELQVERDGKFQKVAERTDSFDIWKPAFEPLTTRRVRLVSHSGQPFHLAEVELY